LLDAHRERALRPGLGRHGDAHHAPGAAEDRTRPPDREAPRGAAPADPGADRLVPPGGPLRRQHRDRPGHAEPGQLADDLAGTWPSRWTATDLPAGARRGEPDLHR